MLIRWLLAAFHLLALGLGLGGVIARGVSLRQDLGRPENLRLVFAADAAWGIAAILWISTGLLRAFAGFERGSTYYLGNTWFLLKMIFLLAILALEIWPMITLIRWRIVLGRGGTIDASRAPAFAQISMIQALLVTAMLLAATAMARGYG